MALWISQVEAEGSLRPVLYQADVRVGSYVFASRWLRVVRPNGEMVIVSFERRYGESEAQALERMSRDLSVKLGIVDECVPLDI